MSKVTAVQSDPNKPGADDWRPVADSSLAAKERAEILRTWGDPVKAANDETEESDETDDDLDEEEDEDLDEKEEDEDEDEEEDEKPAAKKPAKKTAVAKPEPEPAPEEDDDSDLDENDDEKPADPAVAKGMAKLQKQEQRMRQQFDRERSEWQSQVAKDQEALQAEKAAAAEAKAELAKLRARAKLDPAGVLEELGVDDWDYAAKHTFGRTKDIAANPANKEAVARLQREKEYAAKLTDVEKKLAEREKADEQSRKEATMRAEVGAYFDGVIKTASTVAKASTIQRLMKSDPDYTRELLGRTASALFEAGKPYPDAKAVVIAAEKAERALLRRHGINPKTLAGKPAMVAGKPANGKAAQANGKKPRMKDEDELKMPTREEVLEEEWSIPNR